MWRCAKGRRLREQLRRPTSTPSRSPISPNIRATAKSSAASSTSFAGTPWRWSSEPTSGATGIGGHISTYASAATLYEVAFNHFFHGKEGRQPPDQVFFQGHAAPGIYARAFLLGRLTESTCKNFRRELQAKPGLSSYPHPWLMPDFWEFPTVSMGLGPIMAIYQARFNHYLVDRGIKPRRRGVARLGLFGRRRMRRAGNARGHHAGRREKLDNLIFVVNCNLQRLDGPVRGNGKIIQELEGAFRGAGWNVIKVIWGSDWDPLLAQDTDGLLVRRMGEVVDGEYQKYVVSAGDYIREHFFGVDPRLEAMVADLSDDAASPSRIAAGMIRRKFTPRSKAAVEHGARRRSFWPIRSRAMDWARPARAATSPTSRRSSTRTNWSSSAAGSTSRSPMTPLAEPNFTSRPKTVPRCDICASIARRWADLCRAGARRRSS